MLDVRPSPIAGTWYPGSPDALARSVDAQLRAAEVTPPDGKIIAVIVPHAGHRYSGQVAALAFHCLEQEQVSVVAIVSPMHLPHPGRLLTTGHGAYDTPLGQVEVDLALVGKVDDQLAERGAPRLERIYNDEEHSLEIELPFLQRALRSPFRLVPIMIRDQSARVVETVGHALAAALQGAPALLVASSDLSHFYPDPIARRLDAEMLRRLESFDPNRVLEAEEEGAAYACGRGPVAAVMWAARDLGADSVQTLGYANSGDVTGDHGSVVGYAAAVIYRAAQG